MKRFAAAVLLSVLVASTPALARGVKRDVAAFLPVTMDDVLSHPLAFLDKPVVFDAYFAGLGDLYRPFQTPFIRDHYVNFRAWAVGSRLWLKEARENAFLSLYCPRWRGGLTDFLQSLEILSAIRIYGRVRIVYGGYPWVEVDAIMHSSAKTYTEKGLKHIGLGMARLSAKDYPLAARSFKTALDEGMPRNAEALVSRHLGEAYYKLGDYAKAEEALVKALDILSEAGQPDPDLYMRLGQTHNELGSHERALEELKKAIDLEPGLAEAHAALGLTLGELGRYREGLMVCDTALKLKGLPAAQRNKAIIYLLMDNTDMAIKAYNAAINALPTWPLPRKELGDVYMGLKDYAEAEKAYLNLVHLQKDKAEGYILWAQAKLKQESPLKVREAIDDYKKAIEVDPQHIPGYMGLAEIYVTKLGMLQEAVKQLEEAVRVDPQHVGAHMSLGRALEMVDRLNEAAEEYARAVALSPGSAKARLRYALALWNRSEPDCNGAIAQIETALAGDPQDQEALRTLGRFYAEVGPLSTALAKLKEAKRLKEDDVTARQWLAETYRRLRQNSAALKELAEIEKLDPENMHAKADHAVILASLGRDLNRAAALAEEAVHSDPEDPDFLDALGQVEHQRGSGRAAGLFLKAAKTSKQPDVLYHLALVSYGIKNLRDAKDYIEKADELLKALPGEGAGRQVLSQDMARLRVQIDRGYKKYVRRHGIGTFGPEEVKGGEEERGHVPVRLDAPVPTEPQKTR